MSVDGSTTQAVVLDSVAAMSDRGNVIAYEVVEAATETTAATSRVWIRDRIAGTSRAVAEAASTAPGISGNGCIVAYSVLGEPGADAVPTVVDRCAAGSSLLLPIGTLVDTETPAGGGTGASEGEAGVLGDGPGGVEAVPPPPVVGTPALSFDGSTIAWSNGAEIVLYEREGADGSFVLSRRFDTAPTPTDEVVTGASLDMSADGSLIVYTAGPGTQPFAPNVANVYLWNSATDEPELLSSTSTGEPGTASSGSPTISADGSYVVFESTRVDPAAVDGTDLVESIVESIVVGIDRSRQTVQVLVNDATKPVMSSDGLHVAYERAGAIRVLSSTGGVAVDVGIDGLGAAQPGGPVAISQHGRWLVFASAVDLTAGPATEPPQTAAPLGPPRLWAADRTASNPDVVDTTTTTTTATTTMPTTTPNTTVVTTTSTPPGSSTSSTVPEVASSTTEPVSTSPTPPIIDRFPTTPGSLPRVVIPTTVPRPVPRRPFVPPTRPPTAQVIPASASPIVFDRTVVDVGRRLQPLTLFNSTANTIGITATTVDTAGPFSIVADVCAGVRLAPSASCVVDVQFAPADIGVASAVASFALSDGSVATASLSGEGVAQPTLDLVPAVAGAGQTVTVFGSGFPVGSVVELTQPGVAQAQSVVVDPNGTFAHVVVILPNTPTGPAVLSVAGQPDVFADVDAELLVSSRGATSSGPALRSSLGNPPGR